MAVRRVLDGESPREVIDSYGLARTTIYKWLRLEREGGKEALTSRKGTGRPRKLNERQRLQVRGWIAGKDPRQYGFDFGLWTRRIVADLVRRRFGVRLGVTSVGRLLASLGITPQKPLRRAYERDPEAIERWKRQEYPRLRKRARERGARIFFLDEAGVRSDAPLGKTWGVKGETPEVPTSGRRQAVSAISAVNARGAFWYDVYTGRLNATRFIEFLCAFLRRRPGVFFLVVDGHPAHRAKIVAEFVQSLRGRLEIHFLPGYAPDLNPDEFVWNHLRQRGVTKKPLRRGESLFRRVVGDLRAIQGNPALVRSFFHAPSVAYIMD